MSKVIQFDPQGNAEKQTSKVLKLKIEPKFRPIKEARLFVARMFKDMLKALHYAVFYLLMWARTLIRFVCSMASGLGLLVIVILFFVSPEKADIMLRLAFMSFGAFLIGWLYDGLLLKLSPEALILDGRFTN